MKKKEPFCTVGGNVIDTATMENSMEFLKKLKVELPYHPAIPLLGVYPEQTIIQKESCTTMFIATLCTRARTRNPP